MFAHAFAAGALLIWRCALGAPVLALTYTAGTRLIPISRSFKRLLHFAASLRPAGDIRPDRMNFAYCHRRIRLRRAPRLTDALPCGPRPPSLVGGHAGSIIGSPRTSLYTYLHLLRDASAPVKIQRCISPAMCNRPDAPMSRMAHELAISPPPSPEPSTTETVNRAVLRRT